MSVISMTGFGRGQAHGQGMKVVVELGSVNRKQFDCHIAVPRELAAIEARIHAQVHAAVRRGHVKGTVQVARAAGHAAADDAVDVKLARARVKLLRDAARELGLPDDLTASVLTTWRDVVRVDLPELDPHIVWPLVEQATAQALKKLATMRSREGRALRRDLEARLARLRRGTSAVRQRAPRVAAACLDVLNKRIAAASGVVLDPATLARELALLADRCDISEELTRLDSHFEQAATLLAGSESCGRTMDFLCQEFFREINTIGSKANDAGIARQVVALKADLEALREQVQNVE